MRLVAVSDTHGFHDQLDLPEGDLLVHCGDFCMGGSEDEAQSFLQWFTAQPHPTKLFIAGNHDFFFEREPEKSAGLVPANLIYLNDSGIELGGLKFWGSPWTPNFHNWAFMLPRGEPLAEKWKLVPSDTDVLITHGPAYGHGDLVPSGQSTGAPQGQAAAPHRRYSRAVGSLTLLHALIRVRPKLHMFGHIHDGYGLTQSDEIPETLFANASTCTEAYQPENPPLVIDL